MNRTGQRPSLQFAFVVLFALAAEAAGPLKERITFSHQRDGGVGTTEGGSYWNDVLRMYDIHQAQTHATNADLLFVPGCGQGHNEPAWAVRLPRTLRYLLPVQEEPSELALGAATPELGLAAFDPLMRRR